MRASEIEKYDINWKLDRIKKSGQFSMEQIGVIYYAMGIIGINDDLIINPTIPSEYMSMYVRLMQLGIDVTKYIKKNWQLTEIPVYDLESAIMAENGITLEKAKELKRRK